MPFDAFVLNAVAQEITKRIVKPAARLSRIYQLNPTDLLLYFKTEHELPPLFFSIHAQRGRIHFTDRQYSHPPTPPPFCMLIRKHLNNGVIFSLEQPPLERVLYLNFAVFNESGKKVEKTLVAEIMGRHSNLVLLDSPVETKDERKILGVIRPVPPSLNRVRTLLPNHPYFSPPAQEKLHPYALDYRHFHQEVFRLQGQPTASALLKNLQGLSPFLAEEIAARAEVPIVTAAAAPLLWQKLQELIQLYAAQKWEPVLLYEKGEKPRDFTVIKPRQPVGEHSRTAPSISHILDEFYTYKEKETEKLDLGSLLTHHVELALKKVRKKESAQQQELEQAGQANYYRHCGDLLLMNLKQIPAKSREVELDNVFLGQGEKIRITLDPRLTPSLNAQRYFKRYRRASKAEKKVTTNLKQTQNEIAYLESVLFSLQKASGQTLKEIKGELQETGYLPVPPKPAETKRKVAFRPLKFTSSAGEEIYAGRNNRQNEYLVQRFAAREELWFHVKDLPGAHVIIRAAVPHEKTIKEAALLAAYFSRGSQSANVPVDYTQIKNVRRLPGGKPGLVTYNNYRTLFVTPDPQNMKNLLAQKTPAE